MLTETSVKEFIAEVQAKSPVPGGGSVSALVGALGAALISMYQNLTLDKAEMPEAESSRFTEILNDMQDITERFRILVDEDAAAFEAVLQAHRLPANSKEEKAKKQEAIQTATIAAIEAPLAVMKNGMSAIKRLCEIVKAGNKNAVSDAGVAVILLDGAIEGASLNVKINLPGLDQEKQHEYLKICNGILMESQSYKFEVLDYVEQVLEE